MEKYPCWMSVAYWDGNSTNIWGKAWVPVEDDGYVSSNVQAGLEQAKVYDFMAIEGRMWDMDVIS